MGRVGRYERRQDFVEALDLLVVELGLASSQFEHPSNLPKLGDSYGGLNVGKAIVVSRFGIYLLERPLGFVAADVGATRSGRPQSPGPLLVMLIEQHQHPALSGGDHLPGMEAEHGGVAVRPEISPPILGPKRGGRVFHEEQVAAPGQLMETIQLGGQTDLVHDDYPAYLGI